MEPEALRKQTSNDWENRRALGSEFEEVNDSDALKCNSSFVIGQRGGRGRRKRRGKRGGGGEGRERREGREGKRGPFRKWAVPHNGWKLTSGAN